MRTMRIAYCAVLVLAAAGTLSAGSVVGTQVGGGLYFAGYPQNFFDPTASSFVPAGFLNTAGTNVVISATGVEFGFDDHTARITADFTDNALTVTVLPATDHAFNALQLVFADTAFTNLSAGPQSFSGAGITGALEGDVITLDWPGGSATNGTSMQAVFYINEPPAPPLSIQLTPTNAVVISWPAEPSGFHLQQSTNLASTNWVAVETSPTVVNGRNEVAISPPTGSRYYRLTFP